MGPSRAKDPTRTGGSVVRSVFSVLKTFDMSRNFNGLLHPMGVFPPTATAGRNVAAFLEVVRKKKRLSASWGS